MQFFVGTWLPPKARTVVASYPRPGVEGMRWSNPSQWLVVIWPLGHVADGVVQELTDLLADELSGVPTATARFEPPRRRAWLQVPVSGPEHLVEDAFAATEHVDSATHPQKRWSAHLVLARGRAKSYEPPPIEASWKGASADLARAVQSAEGSGYETVSTFPIGAAPTIGRERHHLRTVRRR